MSGKTIISYIDQQAPYLVIDQEKNFVNNIVKTCLDLDWLENAQFYIQVESILENIKLHPLYQLSSCLYFLSPWLERLIVIRICGVNLDATTRIRSSCVSF